jgi:hypothetical protein
MRSVVRKAGVGIGLRSNGKTSACGQVVPGLIRVNPAANDTVPEPDEEGKKKEEDFSKFKWFCMSLDSQPRAGIRDGGFFLFILRPNFFCTVFESSGIAAFEPPLEILSLAVS